MKSSALATDMAKTKSNWTDGTGNRRSIHTILLLSILVIAAVLRFTGLNWGLPTADRQYPFHPDELILIRSLAGMEGLDLNPHYFINPSLQTYIVGGLYMIIGICADVPARGLDLPGPELATLITIGRSVTLVMGLATILLVFWLGARLAGRSEGLVAAAILAVMPLHVTHSRYLTTEVPAVFWNTVAWLLMTSCLTHRTAPGLVRWLLAGSVIGLATSTKYTGAINLVLFFILMLVFRKPSSRTSISAVRMMFMVFTAFVAGFLVGTPYAILSCREFIFDLVRMVMINVHGAEARFPFHDLLLFSFGPALLATILIGMLITFCRRSVGNCLLLGWILIHGLLLVMSGTPFTRHAVILAPAAALVAAYALLWLPVYRGTTSATCRYLAIVATILVLTVTLQASLSYARVLVQEDIRDQTAHWIDRNIPAGSYVGLTNLWFTTPPFDWHRLNVVRLDFDPVKLMRTRPEYIILSDFEYRPHAYLRRMLSRDPLQADQFIDMIVSGHRWSEVRTFETGPQLFGKPREKGYPPHDWMYPYPTIKIFRYTAMEKGPVSGDKSLIME